MAMHQQGGLRMLCAGVWVLLGASAVLAQPLYDQDGIRLHGTVRRVTASAATCHVLEASHSEAVYQQMKANEGEPLHLWEVTVSAVNGSGRWLESLTAHFNIESEWPPCTNWTADPETPASAMWTGTLRVLQKPYGMAPGDEMGETVQVLAFRGRPPTIGRWNVNYEFAESESGSGVGAGLAPETVEAGLGLDGAARRQIQQGLQAAGFDPGGADGVFGPRTRAAIRNWQSSRGARATGYLDGVSVAALRPSAVGQPTFRQREWPAGVAASAASVPAAVAAQPPASPAPPQTAGLERLFWESIANSTNPAEFEAYLRRFPNGMFSELAQIRLEALRTASNDPPAAAVHPSGGVGSRGSGSPVSGAAGAVAGGDVRRRPGDVFRDCAECPEMVVMADGRLAMGRYEVTVGEYRAFASATGSGAGGGCVSNTDGDSWRDPGYPQTDRHPVTCVSWYDAQAYVSWLSRRTGATYRLPSAAEWDRAATGSQPGCSFRDLGEGACPVGSYGSNVAGLSDMVGNVSELASDCWEGDCSSRLLQGGGDWFTSSASFTSTWSVRRVAVPTDRRNGYRGFRVSRTLD